MSESTKEKLLNAGLVPVIILFAVIYGIVEVGVFAYAYCRHLASGFPVSMEFEELNNTIWDKMFSDN